MPIYRVNGDAYDIPENESKGFESAYPNATVEFRVGGDVYDIPLGERSGFMRAYPDAQLSPAQTTPRVEKNFFGGVVEVAKSMYEGGKYQVGAFMDLDAANAQNYKDALAYLDSKGEDFDAATFDAEAEVKSNQMARFNKRVDDWRQVMKQRKKERENMGFWDKLKHVADDPDAPDANDSNMGESMAERVAADKPVYMLQRALERSGGDVEKAREYLTVQSQMSETTGQRMMREAGDELANAPELEGAAWWGGLVPQLAGQGAALAVGAVNPVLGGVLGAASTTGLTLSSAGSAMAEAKRSGATDKEAWAAAGAQAAIEAGSEAIPFGRLMNRVGGAVMKEGVQKALSEASESELDKILKIGKEKIGGKFLSYNTFRDFAKDVGVEAASEAVAGALETFIPVIYDGSEGLPTFEAVLENAWEGAKPGAVMGGFLGGAASHLRNRAHENRRKHNNGVVLSYYNNGKRSELVEVVYNQDGVATVLRQNGETEQVDRNKLSDTTFYTYDEWKNGTTNYDRAKLSRSYSEGEQIAESNGDVRSLGEDYHYKYNQLSELYGEDFAKQIYDNPSSILKMEDGDQKAAALDFAQSAARAQGVVDKTREQASKRVLEAHKVIDSHVSQADGMIHTAVVANGERQVYVVNGELVADEHGNIDANASTGSVAVVDAETGELEMLSPDAFLNVLPAVNPKDEKATIENAIRDEMNAKLSLDIDGRLPFAVGEHHAIPVNGEEVDVMVVDTQDDTVGVTTDGSDYIRLNKSDIENYEWTKRMEAYEARLNPQQSSGGAEQPVRNPQTEVRNPQTEERKSQIKKRKQAKPSVVESMNGGVGRKVTFTDKDGNEYTGIQVSLATEDGVEVEVDGRVMFVDESAIRTPSAEKSSTDEVQQMDGVVGADVPTTALSRVPKNKKGEPMYEQAEPADAWGALLEQADEDAELAHRVAKSMLDKKKVALEEAEKAKAEDGNDVSEMFAAERVRKAAIAKAKAEVSAWEAIVNQRVTNNSDSEGQNLEAVDETEKDGALGSAERAEVERAEVERAAAERAEDEIDLTEGHEDDETPVQDGGADEQEDVQGMQENGENDNLLQNNQEIEDVSGGENLPLIEGVSNDEVMTNVRADIERVLSDSGIDSVEVVEVWSHGSRKRGDAKEGSDLDVVLFYKGDYKEDALFNAISEEGLELNGVKVDVNPIRVQSQKDIERYKQKSAQYDAEVATASQPTGQNGGETATDVVGEAAEEVADGTAADIADETADETAEEVAIDVNVPTQEVEDLGNGESRITSRNSRGEITNISVERDGKIVSVDSYQDGALFEHTEYDADGRATDVTRYNKDGEVVGVQHYKDGAIGKSDFQEYKARKDALAFFGATNGAVNMRTMRPVMTDSEFDALVKDGSRDDVNAYLGEIEDALRVGEGAPLDGANAVRAEYRAAVEQYGKDNIPADVMNGLETRMQSFEDLKRALFDRKYALEDRLRALESQAQSTQDAQAKAEKAAQMQTAFGGFLAGKTALGASSAEKALNKKYKFDGEALSVAEFVERHANDDTLALSTSEVNKYKGASRSAWNRMSEAEQKADEERVKNSGTKTVYMVNGYDLGKTAYEYAQHLKQRATENSAERTDESIGSDSVAANDTKNNVSLDGVNAQIARAEGETNVAPTDGQKESGNYKKGHVRVAGYEISIEQPKGSVRSGVDANGNKWEQTMHNTYGYFRGTEGVDGDHIDVFLANDMDAWNGEQVFVVDQYNEDGSFDEHKVMLGFDSIEEAQSAYLNNYEDGWADKHRIVVTGTNAADFKKWVDSSHRKTKAFADYKNVKKTEGQSGTDNSGSDSVAADGTMNSGSLDVEPRRGAFGTIYTQFKGKAKEAIAFLLNKKEGEAVAALHHPEIGDIDLVWGKEGTGKSDGFGLAKLAKFHPEVLDNLQEILNDMHVTGRTANRVQLESETHQAAVRLTWDNENKNWLLTAFEKKNSVSDNTTDTGETSERGKRNDTATPQNTVSGSKVTGKSSDGQKVEGKNAGRKQEKSKKSGRGSRMLGDYYDQEFEDGLGNGHDVVREEPKTKGTIFDFTSKDKQRPALQGVHHDGGYAIATDCFVMVGRKDKYDAALDGKTINKKGEPITYEANEEVKDVKYPNWKTAVPQTTEPTGIDIDDLASVIEGIRIADGVKQDSQLIYPISIKTADGKIISMPQGHLRRFLRGAKQVGATEVSLFASERGPAILKAEGSKGFAIVIGNKGVLGTTNSFYDAYTKDASSTAGTADYNIADEALMAERGSEAFARATEHTIDALKAAGVEVVEATDAMVEEVLGLAEMHKQKKAPETVSVQDEHLQTVVSSADGAKVLKDLDSAITEYENDVHTKEKTFLGRLAEVLGATKHGSNSQYATFEAVNGKVFTIRLANHNAKVSNFDNHGENEGISIVVTAQDNNGINNDGNAHVVEFFYDAIKLRKADGKPLVEILKSIKQALYSGEYKDTTGLAQAEEVNIPEFMQVYHGSGAKFDKFDHSFMGSGEGAQAFGWGTYVTEVEGIGRTYARNHPKSSGLERSRLEFEISRLKQSIPYFRGEALEEAKKELAEYEKQLAELSDGKYLYTIEIPKDNGANYLNWARGERNDGAVERIADGLQKEGFELVPNANHTTLERDGKRVVLNAHASGADLYAELSEALGSDKAASEFLNRIGYVGIKYPTESLSGGNKDGKSNYVIFNEADAQITDRVEFLRTADGVVYGWAVGGKVYLTKEGMNPNTPAHEYTHLWAQMVAQNDPTLWGRIVDGLRGCATWNDVLNDKAYEGIWGDDSRMASEVLSRLTGAENYRREMARAQAEIADAKGVFDKAEKVSVWENVKNALRLFLDKVKKLMRFKSETSETTDVPAWMEFVDMALGDLYGGVNPGESGGKAELMFIGEKGAAAMDKAEEASVRLDNLAVAREMEAQGKNALAIKMATGWERGADGKWRYETEDVKLKKDFWKKKDVTLGDVADLGELAKAYPDLKDIKVVLDINESEKRGSYNHKKNTITLYIMDANNTRKIAGAISRNIPFTKFIADYMTSSAKKSVDKTLIHEIQHAIQHREGFAKGGNMRMRIGESEERLGYEGYRKLAGEVEARNVSERMGKTMEERRASLRTETQDVADADQIFIYEGLKSASSEGGRHLNAPISPIEMSVEEKAQRGEMLRTAPAIDVPSNVITRTEEMSARKAAEMWWDDNVKGSQLYSTEIGEVEINKNSVESSLAHRYSQKKLDAITSLVDGFNNAVYLGTLPDSRERGVVDHYFAYPINYDGERNYVFCRAMQDANKNRLYVHEVFVADKIKEGDTLQTAASKPHGGISLYRDILANVLSVGKVTENSVAEQNNGQKNVGAMDAATASQRTGQEDDGETLFSYKPFGGNSGYVGYSMSKRAAQARAEGRFPKTDFKKEYGVTERVLDALVESGIVDNAEWHHTSMYGNRTPFYGWVDDSYAEIYAANKEAVKNIAMGKDASGKTLAAMPAENPYTEMAVRIPEGWYPFVNSLDESLKEEERDAALMERFGDAYAQMKVASENNRLYYEFEANKGRMERAQREERGERLRSFFEERAATASQLMGHDGETATGLRGERGSDVVNARFNAELDGFTEDNADSVVFNLGEPSSILQAAGVVNKNMKLYGSKVAMKMKKHGFEASELRDLPKAIANPIAVFNNYNKDGNRSILTELHTAQGNFLVTLSVGKGQDIDFNIVSSVFGKGENNIINWLNNGYATYINKEKALNYLHLATPIVAASNNQELVSATKVVESFENPQILEQENDGDTLFSVLDKRAYEGRRRYADNRNAENKRIGTANGLTEERADLLEELTAIRHELHTSKESHFNGNSDILKRLVDLNSRMNDAGIAMSFIPTDKSDFIDIDDINVLSEIDDNMPENGTDEYKDWYADEFSRVSEELEDLNSKIEGFLGNIDATYGTSYKPGGYTRFYRKGERGYTDDAVSDANDLIGKALGKRRYGAKQRVAYAERVRRSMVRVAGRLAKDLHLENVDIVTDVNELPEGKKRGAKGFYSKSTGRITIVVPNHVSTYDIEQTVLHEAVAHYGLRKLFGAHFDAFLDNVFENAEGDVRRCILDLAKKNGWDFRTATEEYLASLAEDTDFENAASSVHGWWVKLKSFFMDMLAKAGVKLDIQLTDNELRYILWRSYQNLAHPGTYKGIADVAADVSMQSNLKVGNYRASMTDLDGVAEQMKEQDELFRDETPRERADARERYERRLKTGWFQTQEALQDSMLGLKEAMQSIVGEDVNIEDIAGFENAYLGENRLSSVNKAEIDLLTRRKFKPLYAYVKEIAPTEEERMELEDYMMAKHGLERNALMRERAIEDGDESADMRDFAGLTALTGKEDVAEAEAEAARMVAAFEARHPSIDRFWQMWGDITQTLLKKSLDSGIISRDTFDEVSAMYEYYVPLRGFSEETSVDAYAYLGAKDNGFNPAMKKAEGRRSKADNPFAYLESMAESTIMQGNRNALVKQKMLNFVMNHPSDLFSVSELWLEYDDVADEWKPVFPVLREYDTAADVQRKVEAFEAKMDALSESHPDRYKKGKDAANIPYRVVDKASLSEHQVIVKRNGKDYVITVNGNPRAAQALNGMTNPDNHSKGAIDKILRTGETLNRHLSSFYTTRNPDFVVSNFFRDMFYTNTMVWLKEGKNYAQAFHKNVLRCNPGEMLRLYHAYHNDTLDMNDELSAMFYQFMVNGGETGYTSIRDIESHKKKIAKMYKDGVLSDVEALFDKLDTLNQSVENAARFAAFVTSRQMGRSIDRSIYDAKEISVNFNKKGSGDKFLGETGQTRIGNAAAMTGALGRSGFVFWNAAIQGSTNFGRAAKRHPKKAIAAAATMFALGVAVAMSGLDDDEGDENAYYNLPEYVRRSHVMFRIGDGYVSIPLPIEYRALYGMGELAVSYMSGKQRMTGSELGMAIAQQASQVLPLDVLEGGGGLNAFVPSALKPISEAYLMNKSWTGLPIYKDSPYNKHAPEYTKVYKSANRQLVGLAEWLNSLSGGDAYTPGAVDINPAQLEYALKGYFGGFASTLDKMIKMGETLIGEREYDPRSFLLWNRLVKAGDERTAQRSYSDRYFKLKEEADKTEYRFRNYLKDSRMGVFDYAQQIHELRESEEFGHYLIMEPYSKAIMKLNSQFKVAEKLGNEDAVREIGMIIDSLKREAVEKVDAYDKGRK